MKNDWGWEIKDLAVTTGDPAFSDGSLVEFEGDHYDSHMGIFRLVSGHCLYTNAKGAERGGVAFFKYMKKLSHYFKDQHNPTYNEIQMFEMLFPQLTGIIKEKDNA